MKFARKARGGYVRLYDKPTAIKMLKKDRRVKKIVEKNKREFVIYTKPITPITNNEKEVFLATIGVYKIVIYDEETRISYDIFRVNGGVGPHKHYIHPHITVKTRGRESSSCFGNADGEIYEIRKYYDWYWLVIRCLDLLEDGDREEGNEDTFYYVMIKLQIEYLNRLKPCGYTKKIKKLWELFEYYNDDWELDEMW